MIDLVTTIRRLADSDLPKIGATIGVGEDSLHAFLDVETAGGGYDAKGRVKQLLEPHRIYRNAGKVSPALQARFVRAGLAYPSWGEQPYPKDSYPRLFAALAIDERVALLSCSWGIGQVLGENFAAAGYASVEAMVRAACSGGEAEQLTAAIRFIKANRLDIHLRAVSAKLKSGRRVTEADFLAFATGYNGEAQAKNGYARKLADRANWWAGKPDTPWLPTAVQPGHLVSLDLDRPPAAADPPPHAPPASPFQPAPPAGFFMGLIERVRANMQKGSR